MADVNSRGQLIDRDELAKVFKNARLVKQFENVISDVVQVLPDAVNQVTVDVAAAQATANIALADAATAQATATSALSAANTAQATADALALRDVPLPLVDAPLILVDALQHNAFSVTLGGNRTLDAPSVVVDGALLSFALRQDATGGRTLAFDPIYNFGAAGTPVLSTSPGAVDYAFGYYDAASTQLLMTFRGSESSAASFSAHNNGVAQSIPNNVFTKLTFSTEDFDVGSYFAGSTWTPPAGKPVMFAGAVTLTAAAATLMTVMVYKNGAEFRRGTMIYGSGTSVQVVNVSCIDIPNGTDTYELWAYQNTGAAQNTVATSNLTYFQGTSITN
ncbi:hypothetical protein J2X90_000689 [Variovorax paradoxus]|uniref:hypothetical protein n=1 Tax=Variovorax paradoxus TaxID=34073 RepID=UPI002789E2EF|nr:hypothetical protein [Variovorax paradoxus]MDQ0022903.1 hypothetical protein [Variovorax paradoxus]